MATDYVTCPITRRGQLIFGVGCGLLTMLIRYFGSFAEGASFAILVMNLLVPYIEKITMPRRFGAPRRTPKA
jgi:electron transport complex protein RnfD